MGKEVSRRGLLAGVVGLTVVGCAAPPAAAVPHQAGVTTQPPAAAEFLAFDVTASGRASLAEVFARLAAVSGSEVTMSVGASPFDGRFGLHDVRTAVTCPTPGGH